MSQKKPAAMVRCVEKLRAAVWDQCDPGYSARCIYGEDPAVSDGWKSGIWCLCKDSGTPAAADL